MKIPRKTINFVFQMAQRALRSIMPKGNLRKAKIMADKSVLKSQ